MPPSAPPPPHHAEDDEASLPPIDDPYLSAPLPASSPRAGLSPLALTSVIAALVPLPLGAVAAILFGWAARREIAASPTKQRGYALATLGMVLGVLLTMAWGAALSLGVWTWRYRDDAALAELRPPEGMTEPAGPITNAAPSVSPSASANPSPAPQLDYIAPKTTSSQTRGQIAVVDIGVSESSLADVLATQRAQAAHVGETLVVMTTGPRCKPCADVYAALEDPLMQTALSHVRLVRVDAESFHEDLDELKIPHRRIPGFFLLAPDLTPRDGIDGGEWDDDIATNIAPVLGAFVRGKYELRRTPWQPLPSSGMRL